MNRVERLNEARKRLVELAGAIGAVYDERDRATKKYDERLRILRGEQEALNAEVSTLVRRSAVSA